MGKNRPREFPQNFLFLFLGEGARVLEPQGGNQGVMVRGVAAIPVLGPDVGFYHLKIIGDKDVINGAAAMFLLAGEVVESGSKKLYTSLR